MAIMEECVEVRISGLTAKHYEQLGYVWHGSPYKCVVRVCELPRGSKIKVTKKCDNCGALSLNRPYCNVFRDRMYGKDLCSNCMYDINVAVDHSDVESYGEYVIRMLLTDRGVKFSTQVRRKGLTGVCGRPLTFDFAIIGDDGEPILYIEYDGQQHYEPVDFEGKGQEHAAKKFTAQQEHDRRKDRYSRTHGIPLLRIRYDTSIQDIERVLNQFIEVSANE